MPGELERVQDANGNSEDGAVNGVEVTTLAEIPKVSLIKPLFSQGADVCTQISHYKPSASAEAFCLV